MAVFWVRLTIPALAAPYASSPSPINPLTELMLTIAPFLLAIIPGRAALVQRNALLSTMSKLRSQISGSIVRRSLPSEAPALLTRMSTGAKTLSARAKTWSTPSGVATSASTAIAVPPASSIPLTTDSARSPCRSATTTVAPSWAKSSAVARPIPEPPPVTTATLLARSTINLLTWVITRCARGHRVIVRCAHGDRWRGCSPSFSLSPYHPMTLSPLTLDQCHARSRFGQLVKLDIHRREDPVVVVIALADEEVFGVP